MEKADAKAANPTKALWRKLSIEDIPSLAHIADQVHPGLPERDEVFAERIRLFPEGCLALVNSDSDELCGYAISHPILRRRPPALDTILGTIASSAGQYCIHDPAILPQFRAQGLAQECIQKILAVAAKGRFETTGLVSVYGTARFWGRFWFMPLQEVDEVLQKKLRDYGDDAVFLERRN